MVSSASFGILVTFFVNKKKRYKNSGQLSPIPVYYLLKESNVIIFIE